MTMNCKFPAKNNNSIFFKTLFSLAFPIILQNLMQTFVNMLDTIMVGRLGGIEIASVGLGNQVYFMLSMVIFGITSGGSIFISQFWGQGNIKGIRHVTGIMLFGSAAFSLLFFVGAFFFPEFLLGLFSKDREVILKGISYLKIVAFSYPVTAVSIAFQMAFRSTEHVYLPMFCTGVSLVLNVILNALLIFGCSFSFTGITVTVPSLGVAGAALATLICRCVELVIVLFVSYTKKYEVWGKLRDFLSFNRSFALKVIKTSLPVLISETVWGLGITFQNGIFARCGTDAIAAFNITNTISQLTWVFFIGMGNASAIILGKKIGAGDICGAKWYVNRFIWFMPLTGALIGLFLIPLSHLLPFLFNVEANVLEMARQMIYVLVAVYPLRAFNMLLIVGICRSGGDTFFGMAIDNGFMWIVSIPLAITAAFVLKLPPYAVMLFLESEQLLKAGAGLPRVLSGKWLHVLTK